MYVDTKVFIYSVESVLLDSAFVFDNSGQVTLIKRGLGGLSCFLFRALLRRDELDFAVTPRAGATLGMRIERNNVLPRSPRHAEAPGVNRGLRRSAWSAG